MRKIYKFFYDYGRMGEIDAIFTAESADVEKLYGKTVYFGEILGKHSEVSVQVSEENFTVLSEDADFVSKFEEILGQGTVSGNNPLDYWEDREEQAA